MNENIDLTKILKDCPEGWEFYSSIYGCVTFRRIENDAYYPIIFSFVHKGNTEGLGSVTERGLSNCFCNGECTFFPSKEQRDWSEFSAPWYKKDKFDPKTLMPFDRVIARVDSEHSWNTDFFSCFRAVKIPYCISGIKCAVIPYNDDTKHLVGTTEEAPEYYKYWED